MALANGLGYRYSESRNAGRNCTMPTHTRDLFDDATLASPQAYLDAFESWVVAREHFGAIRERSSVAGGANGRRRDRQFAIEVDRMRNAPHMPEPHQHGCSALSFLV